jgi:hypothetical protein
MESKGCKRFATTEAEMEEKRLKLNAERTIKQNKAAKNGKSIAYNYTVTCIMCAARYLNWGIRSPMAIRWLFLEHSHQHNCGVLFKTLVKVMLCIECI